ncbi:MAG: N-acetyltransferase [Pseudomonadota bacterium]
MIKIQSEKPNLHADAIEALYDRTFGPGHFAKTAERLREGTERVVDCCQVALNADRVVGACRIWPLVIGLEEVPAVFVGPLAVEEDQRGKTLGQDLTRAALAAAGHAGWPLAVIVGAPEYFGPVGFKPVPPGQLTLPGPQDPSRILYCGLAANAVLPVGEVKTAMPRLSLV